MMIILENGSAILNVLHCDFLVVSERRDIGSILLSGLLHEQV